jgi:predicted outer membrane repeat protein
MPYINRTMFHGNTAVLSGGGIFTEVMIVATIVNCTFSDNSAPEGGGVSFRQGDLNIRNTIIGFSGQGGSVEVRGNNNISISYSDFYGNPGGDWFGPIADMLGVNGNISIDPLFVDHSGGDCRLSGNSPCIDAGDPVSPYDPDGTIADMGVFYFDQLTGIKAPISPHNYFSVANYPNPFNSSTTILFHLPRESEVNIYIYDILGREIESVCIGYKPAGEYSVIWNAGIHPSGVYIYKIEAGEYLKSRAMLYLK